LVRRPGSIGVRGASRRIRLNAGEKRQRFNEARGQACEAAVAVELAAALGLLPAAEAEALLAAADKVAAMLTGLIRKHSGTP